MIVENTMLLNGHSSISGSPLSALGVPLPSLPGKPLTAGALQVYLC